MADAVGVYEPVDANNLPQRLKVTRPLVSRYYRTRLLEQDHGPSGSQLLSTIDQEVYGDPSYPIRFRIGNGGAGFTGLLKALSETYIYEQGNDFRIGWVANHSRHSQLALLADIVQVALTYEPENEDISIAEGWATRVGRVFNDHFILVGPADEKLEAETIGPALKEIAEHNRPGRNAIWLFHSRGDGSATFAKEQRLWQGAGVDTSGSQPDYIKIDPLTPYEALVKAEKEQAFLLTDRATFLTAKQDGVIARLVTHVEGGKELLNPCSALVAVNSDRRDPASHDTALVFARWLRGSIAQEILGNYGKDWKAGLPLFTVADQDDFDVQYGLRAKANDGRNSLRPSRL